MTCQGIRIYTQTHGPFGLETAFALLLKANRSETDGSQNLAEDRDQAPQRWAPTMQEEEALQVEDLPVPLLANSTAGERDSTPKSHWGLHDDANAHMSTRKVIGNPGSNLLLMNRAKLSAGDFTPTDSPRSGGPTLEQVSAEKRKPGSSRTSTPENIGTGASVCPFAILQVSGV